MDVENTTSSDKTFRVSFGALLLGVVAMIFLGVIGGLLGRALWPARAPLLTPDNEQFVATVQEVTISPNIASVRLLENSLRSVVLIGLREDNSFKALATGVVVTNDGLIVTIDELPAQELVAWDDQGQALTLERVGQDDMFGLVYLRIKDDVLQPLDLRSDRVPVAGELMAISRSDVTLSPRAFFYQTEEEVLPPELTPKGISRMILGTKTNDDRLLGSPLLDEDGKLAGILYNPAVGLVLPADQLRLSLSRVTSNQRELNSLSEIGLGVRYTYSRLGGEALKFAVAITSIAANSTAAEVGLARGDFITAIDDQEIEAGSDVVGLLAGERPLVLKIQRGEQVLNINLP